LLDIVRHGLFDIVPIFLVTALKSSRFYATTALNMSKSCDRDVSRPAMGMSSVQRPQQQTVLGQDAAATGPSPPGISCEATLVDTQSCQDHSCHDHAPCRCCCRLAGSWGAWCGCPSNRWLVSIQAGSLASGEASHNSVTSSRTMSRGRRSKLDLCSDGLRERRTH